jgi:hypothetical protein
MDVYLRHACDKDNPSRRMHAFVLSFSLSLTRLVTLFFFLFSSLGAQTGGAGGAAWGSKKGPPSSVLQEAAKGGSGAGGSGGSGRGPPGRGSGGGGRGAQQGGRNSGGRGDRNNRDSGGRGDRNNQNGGRGGDGGGRGGRGDRNNNKNNSNYQNGGRGGDGGGRGGKNNNNNSNNNNNNKGGNSNKARSKALEEIELWNTTGSGTSAAQKAVHRTSCAKFLSCRLQYLDAPLAVAPEKETEENPELEYTPHKNCHWTAEDRVEMIQTEQEALWNYKPLQVNDDTRWKAKVMLADADPNAPDDGPVMSQAEKDAEQLRKAIAILNKLSWTTLHKLTLKFLETIGATTPAPVATGTNPAETPAQPAAVLSKQVVQDCMTMIVDKAMTEAHFAELYARFCSKLATVHKTFKKTLLAICQQQFEETDKEPDLPADMDPAERKYQLGFSKRKSIGLMQFIGELYKMKLIKGGIMIGCLERLLVHDDEEQLECFAKLMTTIGERLQENDDEPEMIAIWKQVYTLAGRLPGGPVAPGNRIKFLLTDLIELRENGWVERRVVEKAKTIAQIHKEAAREEQMGGQGQPPKYQRSQSTGSKQPAPPPVVDNDGFTTKPTKPKKQPLRRVQSDAVVGSSSLQRAMTGGPSKSSEQRTAPTPVQAPISEYLEPKECGQKMKSILKEYFVGGDTGDAILSIEEVVGIGHEGHVERGAAMIEAGILLVVEMKESEVRKFLVVMSKTLTEGKINKTSIPLGVNSPLEFLRDVEIDAPLASSLLATMIAEWINLDLLSLDFLKKCPDYFRSDGRPADFAVQIISKRGSGVTEADIDIVSSLMSDDDKKAHPVVKEWVEAACKSSS